MENKNATISVRLTEKEKLEIQTKAKDSNLSISSYLVKAGLMAEIKSVKHIELKLDLIKSAGTIGKVGGLLKIALLEAELSDNNTELLDLLDCLKLEIEKIKELYRTVGNL